MATPLATSASQSPTIERVKYTHDAMIDVIIANPTASQNDIAKVFGYSVGWVSRIFNSDAFQARLAERKTELVDPTILLSVEEKLRAVASRSLDVVLQKLETPNCSGEFALKGMEISAKALGYGVRESRLNVQQNFVVALPGKAANSQEWLERTREAFAPQPALAAEAAA